MKNRIIAKLFCLTSLFILPLASCVRLPENIQPVQHFELAHYLGKWYEIARLDHSFERGLSKVSAEYSLRGDGGITVTNRGFSAQKQEWQEATGKAYFVDKTNEGFLKVSFFGPFYGAYIIFELDNYYQYAFISGPNKDYLWLLSRTPSVPPAIKEKFLQLASEKGFDVSKLIFPAQ